MIKYVDLKALQVFKAKQDEEASATYATKESIPTKVSALNNDSGYQTSTQVSSAITSALSSYSKTSHTHSAATSSAAGFMSASDKSKLDGIASKANAYTHPSYTAKGNGLYKVTVDSTGHVSATAAVAKSDITALGIPASDTTYSAATASAAGLMSAADKSKLDGIAAGANKYTYTLPTASSSTLGGVKTTSTVTSSSGYTACPIISGVPYYKDTNTTYSLSSFGVTATAAELNTLDGITATATELNYMDGVTSNVQTQLNSKAASNHDHSSATTSAAGFMTAAMVTKLNGIATGANAYSLPTATSSVLGGVRTGSNITNSSGTISLTKANVTSALGYTPPTTNTTYSAATSTSAGLMSASDKAKLDGISAITTEEIDALWG